jgi:hypothetical protein
VLGNFWYGYVQIVPSHPTFLGFLPNPKLALFPLQEFKEYVEKRLASLEEPKAPYLNVGFWMLLVNLPFKPLESQEGGMKSMTKGISRPNSEVGVQVPASVPSSRVKMALENDVPTAGITSGLIKQGSITGTLW